jgi:hypothetical protein
VNQAPSDTHKHDLKISNQEFLRLMSLEDVRVLSFEELALHLGSSIELFNGKTRTEVLCSPLLKLLCGDQGPTLVDKMGEVNKDCSKSEPYLIGFPSDGLIFKIVNSLCPGARCIITREVSNYLDQYAVGNEYGLSMITTHYDRGCKSFQLEIETGEPDLNRYMFK